MKTEEELKVIKEEYEALTAKLKELTEEELKQVVGGIHPKERGSDKNAKILFE